MLLEVVFSVFCFLAACCSFKEQLFQSMHLEVVFQLLVVLLQSSSFKACSLEVVFWLLAAFLKSKSTALRFSLLFLCLSKSEKLLSSLKIFSEHEQEQPVQSWSTSESNLLIKFFNFKEQEQELLSLLAVIPPQR